MSIMYSVVTGSLLPIITGSLVCLLYTVTRFSSNTAMQSLSHKIPIEMRGLVSLGKMWAFLA